jgi:glutamate synthase domain-containing protein 3
MNVKLLGFANDYVCKGMAGGEVVISPFLSSSGKTMNHFLSQNL